MRDCAAEALPAAETAEAEQGQRSVFCEGAATPEAKAGHRNPGGLDTNNAGASLYSRPPQRDPIFRDAKVLLFWCDQQQKELLVRYFPFVVTVKGMPNRQASLGLTGSYIKYSMVLCICYK